MYNIAVGVFGSVERAAVAFNQEAIKSLEIKPVGSVRFLCN